MSDIKTIVGLLSKVVNNFFNINLKAEHFRLAKYDKDDDDVVPVFWDLLNNCCKKNNNSSIVLNVKLYFASLMYKSAEFYSLPEDMSNGSRELLLAFSWLLCKKNILDSILKTELAKSDISKEFNIHPNTHKKHFNSVPSLKTIEDFFNYILLLSGQINNNLKQSMEYQNKTLQMTTKVHKDTLHPKNISHLSIAETYFVKNHEELRSYLNKIQGVSHLLDNYFKWQSKESYYWEWMVTVLKEKGKDTRKLVDIQILNHFHNILRNHVKNMLTKTKPEIESPKAEMILPRCIFVPNYNENVPLGDNVYLDQLEKQNERNMTSISDFLKSFQYNQIL